MIRLTEKGWRAFGLLLIFIGFIIGLQTAYQSHHALNILILFVSAFFFLIGTVILL